MWCLRVRQGTQAGAWAVARRTVPAIEIQMTGAPIFASRSRQIEHVGTLPAG